MMLSSFEVVAAANRLGLDESQFAICEAEQSDAIARAVLDTFVLDDLDDDEGRSPDGSVNASYPYASSDEWEGALRAALPAKAKRVWVIAESEGEWEGVFDVRVDALVPWLKECPQIRYYVVSPDFDWLMTDVDGERMVLTRVGEEKRTESGVVAAVRHGAETTQNAKSVEKAPVVRPSKDAAVAHGRRRRG